MPGPNLTCAFITLNISDADLVLSPEAFVLVTNYFPLQKQLGCAKSIPSVSSLLLESDVDRAKNECTERRFGEMQRMKASLSVPRS